MPFRLTPPPGKPLRDFLFAYGVEFPCGGKGTCRKCRVRVLEGEVEPGAEDKEPGWILACRAIARTPLLLDIGQWDAPVLADETAVPVVARPGRAIAIDLGTTTLVAQLVDLATGSVLGVSTALNPQAVYGSDVMSRIQHALGSDARRQLRALIHGELSRMCRELARGEPVESVVIAGNTAMMHLFASYDVASLSQAPFHPLHPGLQTFEDREFPGPVHFLPYLGGFVGSDILAGIIATGMDASDDLTVLIDLGTNGEIVAGTRQRMVCASTAAGPAFEGGRISCGMRAATGAISEVSLAFECHVIGGGPARGVCGSGLVDAISAGLAAGRILSSGRMVQPLELRDGVRLMQADVRELQLAKAAIAAGTRILLRRLGKTLDDVRRVYLAGAFGNYINRSSARAIGLLEFAEELVEPAGNTALLGAKIALFQNRDYSFADLLSRVEHVPLGHGTEFQDEYVDCMSFPNPR